MREWKACSLGDVVDIGSSKRIFYEDYVAEGVPFYRSKEVIERAKGNSVSTELFITEKKFEEISKRWGAPEQGDLLLTSVGTLGVPYLVGKGERFYFKDGNLTWFRSFKKELSNRFLLYWFVSPIGRSELDMASIGSTQAALTIQGLKKLELRLPEPAEQESITAVLSSLDAKIDLLHRQNKTLEALAETLFRQWFVEEAEEGWEEGTLDQILSVKGGTTPSTKNPEFWDGDIHWTTPRDLSAAADIFLFDTARKITEKGLAQIGSGLLPSGTLLMSSRAPVGYLAFADMPIAVNQGYIAIIDDKGYGNHFIYLWLKANMETVHSYANGSTFQEISKAAFKSLELTIPPQQRVNDFEQVVQPLFMKIRANLIQARKLTALRDTLLPKLMSGEVRVELERKTE
jgi:type I restriction enzyme S subunit